MSLTVEGLRSRQRRARLSPAARASNQEHARARRDRLRRNGLSLEQISSMRPNALRTSWRADPCPHCGTLLLCSEATTWCCSGGRKVLPRLPPLPRRVQQMLDNVPMQVAEHSRELNYLFALSAVGVSGVTSGWSHYTGELLSSPSLIVKIPCLLTFCCLSGGGPFWLAMEG